jgi:hypothetical protein
MVQETDCLEPEVGKMRPSNVDLYLYLHHGGGGGHWVQGAWGPQLAMNRFLPLLATQIPTLWIHTSGGEGGGGSDIRSMSSIRPICKCRCPPLSGTVVNSLRYSYIQVSI